MGGRQGQKSVARGSIGEQVFAEVEQLTAGGAMTRLAAFEAIAQKTGSKRGTVAANYYRVARRKGAALQPRQRKAGRGGGSAKRALSALVTAVQELSSAIERQEREIAALLKQNRRIAELRRLLA